ncbi:MAG: aldolase [Rhodopseudomonas sp.]|nr:aldolase [Rhodopseudomonas sp.]
MNLQEMTLRRRLGQQPIAVLWMSVGSTTVIELARSAQADAIVIDMQHGLWDRATLEQAVGAVAPGASALVRVAENSPIAIGQALDSGAEGVIIPLIESASEAAQAVAAARFPPDGNRSGGGVRPLAGDFMAYLATANERTVVGVMIETARGVENAAAIAATPGVDFVLIGTGDLSLSLGAADNEKACRKILKACGKAGIACAIYTGNADQAAARANEGYAMVIAANDIGVVAQGFSDAMRRFRDAIKTPAAT